MDQSVDVILLRSADDPDPYLSAFEEAGLRAVCEPVLAFDFPNQSALLSSLHQRERFFGLVATSPRVATALDRAFATDPDLADRWHGAPAYAVGPKTGARLDEIGFHALGMNSGSAGELSKRIRDDAPSDSLLFLCGNRRRDALPNRLGRAGIPFEELVVYRTRARKRLDVPAPSASAWLVFFSPSGLEAVRRDRSVDASNYRIAAIGPTTAGALEDSGLFVEAVAPTPSPEGLVTAITHSQRDEK